MKINTFLVFFFFSSIANAQDDLLNMLSLHEEPVYSSYLFKGTKVVNGQSVELPAKGVLQFNIQHRFGPLNSGSYYLYGLDYAQVRFSLEYGINDWACLGFGRSSVSKIIDGNLKARLKKQVKGSDIFPFAVALNSAIYLQQYTPEDLSASDFLFVNQLIYTHQLLLARKINRNLSLQITPTFIHYNATDRGVENDNISLGIGGRQKITKRISLNAETFIQLYNSQNNNVISLGFDIETGGHVFQLHVSNSPQMIEPGFVRNTYGDLLKGDIYFGFNISRVFTLHN